MTGLRRSAWSKKKLVFPSLFRSIPSVVAVDFEQLVKAHSASLYRVALTLTGDDLAAADLVQQTFFRWAAKGDQLRDATKARSWLLTTLHREFLGQRRQEQAFTSVSMSEVTDELPQIPSEVVEHLDGAAVMQALQKVDESHRAPLALFYLEDMSYRDIAEMLDVPVGTVMSRLARGKEQLRRLLQVDEDERRQKFRSLRAPAPATQVIHG